MSFAGIACQLPCKQMRLSKFDGVLLALLTVD
jgi:hypothetical protein